MHVTPEHAFHASRSHYGKSMMKSLGWSATLDFSSSEQYLRGSKLFTVGHHGLFWALSSDNEWSVEFCRTTLKTLQEPIGVYMIFLSESAEKDGREAGTSFAKMSGGESETRKNMLIKM